MKSSATTLNSASKLLTTLCSDVPGLAVDDLESCEIQDLIRQLISSKSVLSALQTRCTQRLAGQGEVAERSVKNLMANERLTRRDAKNEVDKAKALDRVAGLEDALDDICEANLAAIGRQVATLSDRDLGELNLNVVVNGAKTQPPDHFDRQLRSHIDACTKDPLQDLEAKRSQSKVEHWLNRNTGMGHIHAEIDPLRYERISNLIDREVSRLAASQKSSASAGLKVKKGPNLAADAFCNLFDERGGSSRRKPLADMLVVVDSETLHSGRHDSSIAQSESGTELADETISRLACDSVITKVELDSSGVPINVGRKYRTATDAQWSAMKAVYSTCGWHGCTQKIQHCELHHIRYWRNGGRTDMDNLVPLCTHHHHSVHEGGWSLRLSGDRSLAHFAPDRTHWKTTKPPTRLDAAA